MMQWLSRFIQPLIPYLMVAVAALGAAAYIRDLQQQLALLQVHQTNLVQSLTQTSQAYFDLKQLAAENQQAQATLRQQLARVSSTSAWRKNQIEGLKHELSNIKEWADTLLPNAINRLHQRPAISGSAQYRDWLSNRDPLPTAREQSAAQSGHE